MNKWVKIDAHIKAPGCLWQTYIHAELTNGNIKKEAGTVLFSPLSLSDSVNQYTFYLQAPEGNLRIYLTSLFNFTGTIHKLTITSLANAD